MEGFFTESQDSTKGRFQAWYFQKLKVSFKDLYAILRAFQ